jgi:DNA processing protein
MELMDLIQESPPVGRAVSPRREMGAYEAMWLKKGSSFRTLAQKFSQGECAFPSGFVSETEADDRAREVIERFTKCGIKNFGVRLHRTGDYPARLRDASHPIELLYYQGFWELTETPCIAVVGSRKPSQGGIIRARRLTKALVRKGYTIVSGLASGIDTTAHETAIRENGKTIAVIGTPLDQAYPQENRKLQEYIAARFLLVSQVPVLRHSQQGPQGNRFFIPERNITMSALTEATVIVEASDTSGTLIQARAAVAQKRKLFILDSCFQRGDLTWPQRFVGQGAVRIKTEDDLWPHLREHHIFSND